MKKKFYKLLITVCFLSAIIKFLAVFYTNVDLFGDEAQYWVWSQNLDFGYFSKPPFLSWVIRFVTLIFGHEFIVLKAIPITFYILSSLIVYFIVNELYNNSNLAIITSVSFYLMPAVSVSSFLLSTDVVLIFFWLMSLFFVLKIRKKPSILNFLCLAIFLGISFLTKYAAVYFLISLFCLILLDQKTKYVFLEKKTNFIFFIISSFLVFLPNIIWNTKNGWVTLNHTSENAALGRADINVIQGFEFILTQGLMLGPLLFLYFLFTLKKTSFSFESKFLLSFSLPIFFIVLFESILVRANANWAAVGLVSFLIFLCNHAFKYKFFILYINILINLAFSIIFYFLIATTSSLQVFDRISHISNFAANLESDYLDKINYVVVEDRLVYSNLRYLYRNNGKVLYTPHAPKEKISSHFHIAAPLSQSFNKTFVFLGDLSSLGYLEKKFKSKKLESKKTLFKKNNIDIYEITF